MCRDETKDLIQSTGGGGGGRERMSWCQPWHGHVSSRCRWSNELTFCSPFSPTAVATSSQLGQGEKRKGTKTHREKWIKKTWKEKRDDEKGEKKRWTIGNLHLCLLLLSPAPQLLLLHSLIFLPVSAEADTGCALPAGPSELFRGGFAASNEIPLVRFWTSTTSPAFSNTSTK